jgi:exopolysaccharide biosynthesis protein
VKGLQVGGRVRLGWRAGSPGALDIVSGNAKILSDGKVLIPASCSTHMCSKNPRTAIGITPNDRVIMFVVDGRTSVSIGFTLHRLAHWMRWLGAVDAVNLDGGGSATMWINGRGVVNHPTDAAGERPVSNAVVVLPGDDPDELAPHPARVAAI